MKNLQIIFTYAYSTIFVLLGIIFIMRGALMPYHEKFLKLKQADLSVEMQFFCRIVIRFIGAYFFALGVMVWYSRDFATICLVLFPMLVIIRAACSVTKPIFCALAILHLLMLATLFYVLNPR